MAGGGAKPGAATSGPAPKDGSGMPAEVIIFETKLDIPAPGAPLMKNCAGCAGCAGADGGIGMGGIGTALLRPIAAAPDKPPRLAGFSNCASVTAFGLRFLLKSLFMICSSSFLMYSTNTLPSLVCISPWSKRIMGKHCLEDLRTISWWSSLHGQPSASAPELWTKIILSPIIVLASAAARFPFRWCSAKDLIARTAFPCNLPTTMPKFP
mmetsp:Transcript_16920/g.37328  ORF Transcript_16920/g.37328 Transcript_16920/m.37328 type:complete len:210 (+) Transcript_16920:937-1566(+)